MRKRLIDIHERRINKHKKRIHGFDAMEVLAVGIGCQACMNIYHMLVERNVAIVPKGKVGCFIKRFIN